MSYEYTIIGIHQHQERLQREAEKERLVGMIRRQRQTGHRVGTVLVKTGTLLILAGKRLQRQNTPGQPTIARRTGRSLSLQTRYK